MKEAFTRQYTGKLLLLILLSSIIYSCISVRKNTISKDIYSFLIEDFYKKYRSDINHYQYFSITSYSIDNSNLIIYDIAPDYNKAVLGTQGDAYYPKDYMPFKNKFFFIEGEITDKPSEKVFTFF